MSRLSHNKETPLKALSKKPVKARDAVAKARTKSKAKAKAHRAAEKRKARGAEALKKLRVVMNIETRIAEGQPLTEEALQKAIRGQARAEHFLGSRKLRLEAVIGAYEVLHRVMAAPNQEEINECLVRQAKQLGIKPDPVATLLRVMLGYQVDGLDSRDDKKVAAAKATVSKEVSRDRKAILYLSKRGLNPTEARELSERKGQGLDIWARRFSARKQEVADKPDKASSSPPSTNRHLTFEDIPTRLSTGQSQLTLYVLQLGTDGAISGGKRIGDLRKKLFAGGGALVSELQNLVVRLEKGIRHEG